MLDIRKCREMLRKLQPGLALSNLSSFKAFSDQVFKYTANKTAD